MALIKHSGVVACFLPQNIKNLPIRTKSFESLSSEKFWLNFSIESCESGLFSSKPMAGL